MPSATRRQRRSRQQLDSEASYHEPMFDFLKKWFRSRQTTPKTGACGAADVRIAEALGQLGIKGAGIEEGAWRFLHALDGRQFLEIDRTLRSNAWYETMAKASRPAFKLTAEQAVAYAFVASCSPSGYVRQDALREMRGPASRLAMVAAMIRSKDWVAQVRDEAADLMCQQLQMAPVEMIFGLYDLHLLLDRRLSVGASRWHEQFVSILNAAENREHRWGLFESTDAMVRREAVELILQADPDRRQDLLLAAVRDPTYSIALWSLDQARVAVPQASIVDLLDVADRHAHAGVRASALRLRDSLHSDPGRLRKALRDGSRSVRNAAAYLLKKRYEESPLPLWRKLFDKGDSLDFKAAATALAEHGEAEDRERLESLLAHPSARLRAMAVHALVRFKSQSLQMQLDAALRDASPRVLRESVKSHQRAFVQITAERLRSVYAEARSRAARIALLNAARGIGKWHELAFLLELTKNEDVGFFEFLRPHFDHWLGQANSNYTALAAGQRESLLIGLDAACSAVPDYPWHRLREML